SGRNRVADESRFQPIVQCSLAGGGGFRCQTLQRRLHDGEGPATLKNPLRIYFLDGLKTVACFCVGRVQGQDALVSATFLALLLVQVVRNKMVQRGQKEGAELPIFRPNPRQEVLPQKVSQERLGQILG